MAGNEDVEGIRDALVRVVAEWTRSDLQVEIAESQDVSLDAIEIRALYLIGASGGAMGFGDLADRGAMSRPTTSKLVSRMSARGFFDRIRSGRTVDVRLTDAGAAAYARLVTAGQHMVTEALVGWQPEEITQFQTQLSRFVAALPPTHPLHDSSRQNSSQQEDS